MAEFKVLPSKELEEGQHTGVIEKIEYRTEPYAYTDVYIKSGESLVKSGYPSVVSEKSKLGKLLSRFGCSLKVDETVDPERVLIGKKCKFLVSSEENSKDGQAYNNVVPASLKPAE